MSSILKALEKVEDRRLEAGDTEYWPNRFHSGEAIRKRTRRTWLLRVTVAAIGLSLLLFAGGWVSYINRHLLKESAVKLVKAINPPEPTERITAPIHPETEPKVAESRPARPALVPVLEESDRTVATPSSPVTTQSPRPQTSRPPEMTPGEQTGSGREAETLGAGGAPEVSGVLDTERFRLEAIVWSINPESRFAVINGALVREGGAVGEASVATIERDRVVVRSGEKTGELRFTHD